MRAQTPKRSSFQKSKLLKVFDYTIDYKNLDLRRRPELYRVGRSEQGVLLVEPYKSEILPFWKFKTPALAKRSAADILRLFAVYKRSNEFVGMDMARKFLQMGYTRSRRYANHKSGRKYAADGTLLPFENDPTKAQSAQFFKSALIKVGADSSYAKQKKRWKDQFG